MKLTNTAESYGLIHQSLHWATAILILVLLPMGVYMHDLPIDNSAQIADKVWFYSLHKSIGMAALFVAVTRIAWAIYQPHPRPLHGGLEGFAAKTVHYLLYGTIIAMPVLGWLYHAATEGFAPIWWPFSQDLPFVPKNVMLSNFFKTAHFVCGVLLVLSLEGSSVLDRHLEQFSSSHQSGRYCFGFWKFSVAKGSHHMSPLLSQRYLFVLSFAFLLENGARLLGPT